MNIMKKVRFYRKSIIIGIFFSAFFLMNIVMIPTVAVNATENNQSNQQTDSDTDNGLNVDLGGGLTVQISGDDMGSLPATLQIILTITVIALAPTILLMVTSFTRILIALHFVRTALGTQTTPPNQVMIGLALFLTLFIMSPVIMKINTEAVAPLSRGEITVDQALELGVEPIRSFMFDQMGDNEKDLNLFLDIANITEVTSRDDIPTSVLIPAFIINELRAAFIMGFVIYIPFIIIDMVVASTLMSMGMMMLPPTTISMPFKILLFVVADGWSLVIGSVVNTFSL